MKKGAKFNISIEITPFVGTFSAVERSPALKKPKRSRAEVVIPSIPRGRSINADPLPLSDLEDSDSDFVSADSDYSDSETKAPRTRRTEAPQPQETNRPAN
ncbi:hypothetical protein BGZ76_007940, partial [Entomortierella beljakovae]